ncbi:hypothetical protein QOT17_003816 [Balamuthia mandrillaris]
METADRSWRKSNDEEEEEEDENSTEDEEEEEEEEDEEGEDEGNANQEPTFPLPTFYQPLSTASMYAPPPLQVPYESFGFVEVGESPLKDGVYHLKRSASTVDLSAEGILNQQRNMEQRLEELCTELARLKERVALLELQEDHRWPVRYSKRLAMIANVTLGSYLFWTRFVNFFKQRRSHILQLLSGAVRLNINSYLPFSSSSSSPSASSSSSPAASLLSSRKKHKRPLFGRNRLIHLLLPLIFSSSSSSLAPNKNAESERTRAKNIFNALLGQAALFALKGSWAYFFGAYLLTRHTMWKRYMGLLMTTLCSLWLQYLYLKSHFLASSPTSPSALPTSLLAPSSATTLSASSLPSAFIPSPDSSFAPSVPSSPSSIPAPPSALIPPSSSSPSLLSPETYLWSSSSSSVFFNQKKKFQLWVLSLAVLLANLLFFSMSLKNLLDGPRGLTSSHDPFYSSKKVPTLFGLLRRSRQQQPTTSSSSASPATPPIASAPLSSSVTPLSPLPSSSSPSLSARHHHHHRRARTIGSSFVFPPPSSPSHLSIDNNTQKFGSAMQRPPLHPLSLDTSSTAPASASPSSHLTHSHSAPQLFHYPYSSSSSFPSSNTLLFSSSSTSIRPTTYLPPPSPSSTSSSSSSSSSFLSPSTHRYSRSHSQQRKDKETEEEEQ